MTRGKWLPRPTFWFGRSIVVPLIGAALSGVMGILQLPGHESYLIPAVLVVTALGWWSTASERERAEEQSQEHLRQIARLSSLLDAEERDAQSQPDLLRILARMTAPEIREAVEQLASELLEFEASERLRPRRQGGLDFMSLPDTAKAAVFHAEGERDSIERAQRDAEYNRIILPRALTIEAELLKRLKRARPDRTQVRGVSALEGRLAGPHPLADVVNYLRGLGRDLG